VVLDADRGLSQGFDTYQGVGGPPGFQRVPGSPRRRPADEVVDDAIQWIEKVGDSRFFAWAHLYDAHRPYDPPEPFRSRYTDPYTAEIAFADSQVGRLLDALDRRKLLDRTIVVVAADHGESLGDHGERDHGIFIYESVLRIPLIVRGPNVAPRRIADIVRLVDVMPTVLDLLDVPRQPVDGTSLAGMLHGDPRRVELDAYSESRYPLRFGWSPLRALRAGRYKLIEAPRPELYDLERDPFEERNIYPDRQKLGRALARRLAAFDQRAAPGRRDEAGDSVPSAELQARLASLGYIGSGVRPAPADHHELPDPKDCIGVSFRKPRPGSCENTRPGSWPVPIGQLFLDRPRGSGR
jgi:arylsulfatase A-like enzyme